jgi:hypothetical protein
MSALVTPEYYADLAETTVGGTGYTAGSGSLDVASTAGSFSATNQMHVYIADQTTKAIKAVLKLTAKNSSTNWTCTADSGIDANANVGDIVRLSLCKGAMDQIRLDAISQGILAPVAYGSMATAGTAGRLYPWLTDSFYTARDNGSSWDFAVPGYGPVTLPPSSGWSWDNQGSSTEDFTYGYQALYFTSTGSETRRSRYRTAPSTPYHVEIGMIVNNTGVHPGASNSASNSQYGVGLRDAGGKIVSISVYATSALQFAKWNADGTKNSNYNSDDPGNTRSEFMHGGKIWFRVGDDGTNLTVDWCIDRKHWKQFDTRARGDFLSTGPTGIAILGGSFNAAAIDVVDYTVTG